MVMLRRRGIDFKEMDEIRKGPWKPEEDEVLLNHVKKYGPKEWSSIRSKGLLKRTGKSCRLRWVNKLRPGLRSGMKFSAEEERTVIDLQAQLGNKWARIATYLPGRTDNDVKNFWSTKQKRIARSLRNNSKSSSSSSSSIKSKINSSETNESGNILNFPSIEAPKISPALYLPIKSEPTEVLALPELFYPNSLHYNQLNCTCLEEKPFTNTQFNSQLPDFSLPLECQELFPKLEDPSFLSVFGSTSFSELEKLQFPGNNNLGNVTHPHDFIDYFPPIDMFGSIELPPKWP